ncbi:MAG: efflux RND transporter permease subunit, partial [Chromatiales bacterium]|nr:efflux RND transporter permease subunit [Chromatiales bacterium]
MSAKRLLSRTGGLAALSARHPIGVTMLAISVVVIGLFSLQRLGVDLLPHLIYPEVRIRITDPGVPGKIMEDQITRQLEEQLAITEDAISVQSRSREARSQVDLTFRYGKDIDIALRDASTRLDRAKRFLPDTIEPPIIYKLDPSQIPVFEVIASSPLRRPSELREWVDYTFSKWFLNLPGMAAVEVGGAPVREVQVVPDQQRLAGFGVTVDDIVSALKEGNLDQAGGRLRMDRQEISGRTLGRFKTVESIASLPLATGGGTVRLRDVAQVIDTERDEKLRIRLDGEAGVKVSFQKQPQANTVAVVDAIQAQMVWLQQQGLVPDDVGLREVSDAAVFVRQAITNASVAAVCGSLLAMLVVFAFLGSIRRTLVIGSSIPLGIMVAFILMDWADLTLNVMTLGGLALGVGLLVDNTVVMLENIYRHQRMDKGPEEAAADAAREVHGAVVASTTTNLVAVLPFLFVGGLIGLLFQELIATISAAIVASLVVALTVVPALGSRIPAGRPGLLRRGLDALMELAQRAYVAVLNVLLKVRWFVPIPFMLALWFVWPAFTSGKQEFLPYVDDGRLRVYLTADSGISLNEMDRLVTAVETVVTQDTNVASVFAQIGGFVFGRSEYQATNFGRLYVQLVPRAERDETTGEWIKRMNKEVRALELAGLRIRMRPQGIRGLRLGRGED